MRKPELLAPAGSLDALKAAVWAGADAVYLGGKAFNARAFADNFGDSELTEAFLLCRLYGVKVYIVLNTLLSDKELGAALAFVDEMEERYIPDAYIVQDIGLISALKERYPKLPIHASTQMQQHSPRCAELLRSLGVERVVLARESASEDISAVVATGIETEVFVHGAICVCQSGGCLMSSAIGGRSGNRGECAQPCRQSYNGAYPLSLKDMCLAKHIPELIRLGVHCLKIEGRMKSPEYVYETVSIYRRLLDECRPATDNELSRLEAAFSRSGFTDGYFTGKVSKAMFGVRTEADKISSKNADIRIIEKKIPVAIQCRVEKDKPAYIKACACGYSCEREGALPDRAINRAITVAELSTRLSKTGGTPFVATVSASIDDGLIMPVSAINELRRSVLTALESVITEAHTPVKRKASIGAQGAPKQSITSADKYTVIRFENRVPNGELLSLAIDNANRVELPLWCKTPEIPQKDKLSLYLPRTVFARDEKAVLSLIDKARQAGITHLTVSNPAHLAYCKGFTVHGDWTLNITNSISAEAFGGMGFSTLAVSPEIRPDRIAYSGLTEYTVYGRTPLMHTETCIISNVKKCEKSSCCTAVLRDKTGAAFPVMREYGHRNVIYNSTPTYLLDKQNDIRGASGRILRFTTESDGEIKGIIKAYIEKNPPTGSFTRGAYKREGGVFK